MNKIRKITLYTLVGIVLTNSSLTTPTNAIYNNFTIDKSTTTEMEVCNTSSLNVRKGAGTNYTKIGSLKKGQVVNVINISNGWAKINYNNKVGYVSASYLKIISNTKKEMVVKSDTLNVRSGASTSYSKIGTLKKGDKIIAIQTLSNGWVKIEYKNRYGYVSNKNNSYLSEISGSTPPTSNIPSTPDNSNPEGSSSKYSTTGDVNLRKSASWSGSIITIVKKGSIVEVEHISNSWAKIKYNGNTGYVPSNYLIKIESNTPSIPSTPSTPSIPSIPDNNIPETPNPKYSVTGDVNLRKSASWSGDIITIIKKGSVVDLEYVSNNWAKIKYNGNTGYIPNNYLSKIEDSTVISNKQMIVKTDSLSVRNGASTKHTKLGELRKGDIIVALEELSNGWIKINYKGKNGYVSNVKNAYLEEVKNIDIEKANNVIAKINTICNISIDNSFAIEDARLAYNSLNNISQRLVTNISILENAENELNMLIKIEIAKTNYIIDQINRLDDTTTLNNLVSQKIKVDAIDKNLKNIHSNFISNISNLDRFNKIKNNVSITENLRGR